MKISHKFSILSKATFESIVFSFFVLKVLFLKAMSSPFFDNTSPFLRLFNSVTKALEIDPNDHEAHRIMGAISLEKGNFELARHHHERAKQLCPSDAYIMGKNAALLVYLGEPEKALETVHWAMRINPFCPDDLYVDEGMCHYWLKNFKEAINCFKKIKTPSKHINT